MQIKVISLIPEVFPPYLSASILGKAIEKDLLSIEVHNLRDYAEDKHRVTDDYPFGGGGGMVLKIEPLARALDAVAPRDQYYRVLLTPQGRLFQQAVVKEIASKRALCLVCGRYEGFDERVRDLVDDELSIGDFVLTGGELAALVVIDAVARLIPGVLGNESSAPEDSHALGLLEYPHYTRPREFQGRKVPEVLLSGNHAEIERWRRGESLYRTWERRPDLWSRVELGAEDLALLKEAMAWRQKGPKEEIPPPPAWKRAAPGVDKGYTEE